jgi:RimJ/RimL family protein N-acetyltransferase
VLVAPAVRRGTAARPDASPDRAGPQQPAGWPAGLRIRPVEPADADALREFLSGLSPDTAYRRFFTGLGKMADRFVARLVCLDHARREALVAVVGPVVIGFADYAVLAAEPDTVEFGVVIADRWQRHGIGPALTRDLLGLAAGRGARTVRAHTLAENARAATMLRRRWPGARPAREDTLLVWDLPL